jgi:DNA repair protein RecO (recombination protein O)
MSDRIQALVLSKVDYGDKTLIVDLYSLQSGRLTASTYSTKKSKNRFYFSPLMVLELDLYTSKKAKLKRIKEVKSNMAVQMANTSMELNAYRFFIAEVLQKTLALESSDPPLYHFLIKSIEQLYQKVEADFIIHFLERLSPYLGLDLEEIKRQGGTAADYDLDFNSDEWGRFTSNTRIPAKEKLNLLLKFYAHHFEGIKHLRSRSVLSAVFS